MPMLGQGLQRTKRPSQGWRLIGIDQVSVAGVFSWTSPTWAELLDIVAVGGGANGGTTEASTAGCGAIAQLAGLPTYPGRIFTGTVGGAGAATTVNGLLSAAGGLPESPSNGNVPPQVPVPTTGVTSFYKTNSPTFTAPHSLFSLLGLSDTLPIVDLPEFGLGGGRNGNGRWPGGAGGGLNGEHTSSGAGAPGGVFFIMYRSLS